ncbi:MAG: transport-associated protein [Betaproteobacteria bacterium]|nr:transport-associated protein [Betaproteobacteria bacterium]
MAERPRPHDHDNPQPARDPSAIADRARDERFRGDRNRGYDETVRHGPPLEVSVARGDYRPGRDELAGAGVRGYGEPGAYRQWGQPDYDERGGGDEYRGRDGGIVGSDGDYAPASDLPPTYGADRDGYGRLGGWTHHDTGLMRPRGPKGYERSDDRIMEDLCEHLMNLDDIDSSDVEVRVSKGVVVLEGTVRERFMKYEIENIAATTLGVKDVENNITVPRQGV